MTLIEETVSRLRNNIKAVKSDAFVTDRFLYSMVLKYGKAFIKRQDNLNKISRFNSLFRTIPCIDLIEVDKVEACCEQLSECTIKRTEDPLPNVMDAGYGPLIRQVTSIDNSIEVYKTDPGTFRSITKSTNFKYNKDKYYWLLNGYLYFPNIPWDQVSVDAMVESDYTLYACPDKCVLRQQQMAPIPDFLFAEIERNVLQDLGITIQLPEDKIIDKENQLR